MTSRYVVTGASGFVGSALVLHAPARVQALRLGVDDWRERVRATDFSGAVVLHLAARVHRAGDGSEADYERDNVQKSIELARAAVAGGARRLVFLSSVKVNGEESAAHAFGPDDRPAPADAYARSKWAAEQALRRIGLETGLEVTVVRSPLVYGAGAKGNLRALMRLADTRWALPFAAIRNRRSFIHVDDLARLLLACADAPSGGGSLFFAAHPAPASTPDVVGTMRRCLARPTRMFAMPPAFLEALAFPFGQMQRVRRLTRSLEVDPTAATVDLGWGAVVSLDAAIEGMVAAYRGASLA